MEIESATNFVCHLLTLRIKDKKVISLFKEHLLQLLNTRFLNRWLDDTPLKYTEYRTILITDQYVDWKISHVALKCGLSINFVYYALPNLTLFIDPGDCCYRIGDCGCLQLLSDGTTCWQPSHYPLISQPKEEKRVEKKRVKDWIMAIVKKCLIKVCI